MFVSPPRKLEGVLLMRTVLAELETKVLQTPADHHRREHDNRRNGDAEKPKRIPDSIAISVPLVVLVGGSGSGKTTIISSLQMAEPDLKVMESHGKNRKKRATDLPGEYVYYVKRDDQDPETWDNDYKDPHFFDFISDALWQATPHDGCVYKTRAASVHNAVSGNIIRLCHLAPDKALELWDYLGRNGNAMIPFLIKGPTGEELRERFRKRGKGEVSAEDEKRIATSAEWNEKALDSDVPYEEIENNGKKTPLLCAFEIIEHLRKRDVPEAQTGRLYRHLPTWSPE